MGDLATGPPNPPDARGTPVKPGRPSNSPVVPAPSATIVLLRDRPAGGIEIMLIQRHRASKFAAGDHVFPGGKIEIADDPEDAVQWCAGLDGEQATRVLGATDGSRTALAHWTGAIREAFEEVGVLLAVDAAGRPPRVDPAKLAEYRRACQRDHRTFWDMVRAERLTLTTDRLAYFAHWITPEENPLRFDVRFFAAPMPEGQHAEADEREIIGVRWLSPLEAFEAQSRGEISLRRPTVANLKIFDGPTSVAEALSSLAGRAIPTIRPRVITGPDGTQRALLPGDPGWY
jgi:8-oxo-dGTP pyrophosphatase MutT (NUDIX family)